MTVRSTVRLKTLRVDRCVSLNRRSAFIPTSNVLFGLVELGIPRSLSDARFHGHRGLGTGRGSAMK